MIEFAIKADIHESNGAVIIISPAIGGPYKEKRRFDRSFLNRKCIFLIYCFNNIIILMQW
jgi:hypothetical protein